MKRGPHTTIRTKLGLFATSIVILFTVLTHGLMIPMFEAEKHQEREATLQVLVESAVSLMEYYENAIRSKKYTLDPTLPKTRLEAQQRILEQLRQSRFGRGEHFFILDGNATMIMHPLKPETENQSMAKVSTPDGDAPFYEMAIKAQQEGLVFVKFSWLSRWSMTVSEPQTTCAKYFYPWNWVICTSTYTQDITDAVNDIKKKATIYLAVGSLVGFIIIYLIGSFITRPIVKLAHQVRKIGENHDIDQAEKINVNSNDEVGELADVFRTTFKQLKTALLELEDQQEKYRLVIENASDAILIAQDGIITFTNQRTTDLFGYSAEDLGSVPFITIVHPDDRNKVLSYHKKRLENAPDLPDSYTFKLLTREQQEKIVQISPVLITWQNRPATLNFLRDITELKRLEEKYLQAQKMEAIGALAGGVAHDLNNILSGIKTYPELLLLKLPQDSPHRAIVSSIYQSGEKAAAIVQDLLTLARRGVEVNQVTNLNKLTTEYMESPEFIELTSNYPDITFQAQLDPNLNNIEGSPLHLSKTIMNLVSNAAEATSDQGSVTVITKNQRLDKPPTGFTNFKAGDYAVLKIVDTGSGIPPEISDKIFEPFVTKKEMGRSGTGLGLSIVWGTIEDHGGHVELDSKQGVGTTFTLYFPTTDLHIAQQETKSISEYLGNSESILIVDDSDEQRTITGGVLEKLSYTVHSVSSGEEAVEYVKTHEIDIVLLDMIMEPGIDGLETYKRIAEFNPQQKALIVSGFSETARAKNAIKLGVSGYIQKPYTIETLGLALKNILTNLPNS